MPESTRRDWLTEWPIVQRVVVAEWWLGLRSGGFWALVGSCALAAAVVCGERGLLASGAAARLQLVTRSMLALFLLLWWATVASRDHWNDVEELLLTKPVRSEWLALGKFLGNFGLVLVAWALTALAGMLSQLLIGRTPLQTLPYLHAFTRVLPGLFFFSALSYAFVLLGRSPVAAGIVGLYWLFVLLARDFLARIFTFFWSQHAGLYVPAGVGIVILALAAYQAGRRSRPAAAWRWGALALACMALGVVNGVRQVRSGHDPPLHTSEISWSIASQHLKEDARLPGFWARGVGGEWVRLSAFPDHILVVGLWSPYDSDSGRMLADLQQVWETYRHRQVTCVAVAISEEHRIARDFAREQGWTYPIGLDAGAREKPLPSDGSPVAEAYDAESLPYVVLADRRRRVVTIFRTWSRSAREALVGQIEALLRRYPLSGGEGSTP